MAGPSRRLAEAIGHEFSDESLLERALVHRSALAEELGERSYERLEFLGDAVLGLAVAHHLFEAHPDLAEGEMAKTRAAVVGEPALARVAVSLGVGDALTLGKGEAQTGGRTKPSILSDAMEAIIGAIYLDAGFDAVKEVVVRLWEPVIAERVKAPGHRDYKSRLQEHLARHGQSPRYDSSDEGPDHAKIFTVSVSIDGEVVGEGVGTSKKRAEQEAARQALERFE